MFSKYILHRDVGVSIFAHSNKNVVPWGEIIQAGASHINVGLNYIAAKKNMERQNRYNFAMAQYQNAWNLAQWKRERDYNTEMWNKTNEYNSPEQQLKRYQAAGVNPYMALPQTNGGTAQAQTAPQAPAAVGYPSAEMDMSGVYAAQQQGVAAIGNIFNSALVQEQAKAARLQNLITLATFDDRIKGEKSDWRLKGYTSDLLRDTYQDLITKTHEEALQSKMQTSMQSLQLVNGKYDLGRKIFEFEHLMPVQVEQARQDLFVTICRAALLKSQKNLTDKQAQVVFKNAAAQWLSALAAMKNAENGARANDINDYTAKNNAWNQNQTTYRANKEFNYKWKMGYAQKEIKLGVDLLESNIFKNYNGDWFSSAKHKIDTDPFYGGKKSVGAKTSLPTVNTINR